MRLQERTRDGRALLAAAGLTLLAGGALAWIGFDALMERERSVAMHYTATTVLVRDRLIAELDRFESQLRADFARAASDLDDRTAARGWLARVTEERPWISDPVLFDRTGDVLSVDLDAGWQPPALPVSADSMFAVLLRRAEAAEFSGSGLEHALAHYRTAHSRASSVSDRVLARMRMARVLYKLRRYDAGLDQYRMVLESAGDIVDAHGIPYAVSALRQMTDGFAAVDRTDDRRRAERQLRDYVLDRPWNLSSGYDYHLALVASLAGAPESTSASRIRRLQDGVERIAWVRAEVIPRVLADRKTTDADVTRLRPLTRRDGSTALVASIAARGGGAREIGLAYELRTSYLDGPLLAQVLRTVDLGRDFAVAVLGPGNPRNGALLYADIDVLPGWRVGLFHRGGYSIQQLAARQRFIYGTFIVGMILILIVGIAFTARASAREAELARLRTDFVASVSHELKTPLALIRMFGETLDSGLVVDEPQRREFYGVIRRESERLTHLIDNVLDIARIDAGTKQYSLQSADLAAIVREAVDAYHPFFERQGFEVATALPPAPLWLTIDRDAVIQALINLFHNAMKYSAEVRQVTVSVAERNGEVRLAVGDRGIGIADDEIARIFRRFYRVRPSGTGGAAGSGLGLSLVAHTMTAHGGRVDVESTPGAGSVFTLVFPVSGGA
jgi:signal transduction histidine kinase